MAEPITLVIIAATVLVSMRSFENPSLKDKLVHHPYSVAQNGEYHRWISSGLVHKDWMHLLINMYVFWNFGGIVEQYFVSAQMFGPILGRFIYLLFYLLAIVASDLPFYAQHKANPYKASLGASGAVSAILFACMMILPWAQILLFFVIPMPFIVAGVLYLAYESYSHNQGGGNVNHLAHIFGAIFGVLALMAIKPSMIPFYWEQLLSGLPF